MARVRRTPREPLMNSPDNLCGSADYFWRLRSPAPNRRVMQRWRTGSCWPRAGHYSPRASSTRRAIRFRSLASRPKAGWNVTVPTTVVAAQVKHKFSPDPFFGMNLRQYPGMGYPIGANFSNIPMPPDSPYAASWWYRKTFSLPASDKGKTIWLNFRGHQLPGEHLAEREADREGARTWRVRGGRTNST